MRYIGGKSRIAKELAAVMLGQTTRRHSYVEPFLGGGAMLEQMAPHFRQVLAGDVVEDLVLMWQAAQAGWLPPRHVSEERWRELKDAEPSAERGFVGFACSFGAKWFSSYARGDYESRPANFADEGARAVRRIARAVRAAQIVRRDYRGLEIPRGSVIYCDPPYSQTAGYDAAGDFDSAEFWRWATERTAEGHIVFVSEYSAPEGWRPVWRKQVLARIREADERTLRLEQLWRYYG